MPLGIFYSIWIRCINTAQITLQIIPQPLRIAKKPRLQMPLSISKQHWRSNLRIHPAPQPLAQRLHNRIGLLTVHIHQHNEFVDPLIIRQTIPGGF